MARKLKGLNLKNKNELITEIDELGKLIRSIFDVSNQLNKDIAKLKREAHRRTKRIEKQISIKRKAIVSYAKKNRQKLTEDGKRKSIKFLTGILKWYMTPPKANISNTEQVIQAIRRRHLVNKLIRKRVISEINKDAMLANPKLAETIPGVSITQKEMLVVLPSDLTKKILEKYDKFLKAAA